MGLSVTVDPLYRDFPQKMSAALSENPASVIHSLNLAHNSLDNQGTMKHRVPFGCFTVTASTWGSGNKVKFLVLIFWVLLFSQKQRRNKVPAEQKQHIKAIQGHKTPTTFDCIFSYTKKHWV